MRQWYEKPMRIAALQCNFEGPPEKTLEVADKWGRIGFNVEQLFHPMADCYSALFDPAKHTDILSDYIERAKVNGLRLIVYLNVHILGPSLAVHADDWAQRTDDGTFPKLYDTYYATCFNSPWRDFFFSSLDKLVEFDIDGVFLDGPVTISGGCRCPHCRELHRSRYGKDIADDDNLREFLRVSRAEFLKKAYGTFKAAKPEGVFYMNLGVMHARGSHTSLAEALEYNDIVGTEGGFMFYAPAKNAYLWKATIAAKVLEAVAPRKPRVIFMAGDQKPWSWYMHTPSETRLCIASTVASGANIWYGLHGSTRLLDTPGGRAGAEMIRFLADNETHYDATESAARVAVMYSYDTTAIYGSSMDPSDFYGTDEQGKKLEGDFSAAFQGVCDVLSRSGVPFDVITEMDLSREKLARYDCVFLATCACMSDETLELFRRYVRGGGNIIASFDTSLYDSDGNKQDDFGLADVFGVSFGGKAVPYHNFNYFSSCGRHELFAGVEIPLIPAPLVGLEVEAVSSSVLARFHGCMPGRYVELTGPEKPAIVLNKFGRGKSLYFAGTFAEMAAEYNPIEYRRIFANAAAWLADSPVVLEGALGSVEVTVRRRDSELIVHLVNYAGVGPRPFESVAPQEHLSLRVRTAGSYTKARALVAGHDCELRTEGSETVIRVPALAEYEVIVIT